MKTLESRIDLSSQSHLLTIIKTTRAAAVLITGQLITVRLSEVKCQNRKNESREK